MFFTFIYFGRQRERKSEQGRGRERETQNPKQAPGSALSAQSPKRGSNSRTARSRPELKSDAQLTEPPRHPSKINIILPTPRSCPEERPCESTARMWPAVCRPGRALTRTRLCSRPASESVRKQVCVFKPPACGTSLQPGQSKADRKEEWSKPAGRMGLRSEKGVSEFEAPSFTDFYARNC